jgi:hypothetical protein
MLGRARWHPALVVFLAAVLVAASRLLSRRRLAVLPAGPGGIPGGAGGYTRGGVYHPPGGGIPCGGGVYRGRGGIFGRGEGIGRIWLKAN